MVEPKDFQWTEVNTSENTGNWRGYSIGFNFGLTDVPPDFYRGNESFLRSLGYTGDLISSFHDSGSDGGGG